MYKPRPFIGIFGRSETLVVVFVLIAAFLRVYRLNEFPPALYWDEAFDGLDAWRVATTASHPIFFDGDLGREPLEIYLQAVGIFLFGARDWVLRAVPAFIGIATVPVLFRLTMTLYSGEAHAKMISALAAGMLAVSFWHIDISRISNRTISVPFFSAITVWLYWRAFQSRRLIDYGLCGAALGPTLYTYLPSRLLPLVLVAFVVAIALLSSFHLSRYLPIDLGRAVLGLGAALAAMLVVFAPLGFYFLSRPGAFFLRASYISIFSGDAQGLSSLLYNIIATARMFIDRGDMEPLRNLPGQPALDLVATVGFWVGLTIALARIRLRPAYLLLLIWLALNLAATIFSVEVPHFYRTSGALLPALVLAADGLMWLWHRVLPKSSAIPMIAAVVVLGGVLSFNSYFNVWGPSKSTYEAFDGSRRTVLDRAIALSRTTDVVMPFSLYGTPNAKFYLAEHFGTAKALQEAPSSGQAVWIAMGGPERNVVVLGRDGRILVPEPLDDEKYNRLGKLLGEGHPLDNSFGQSVATEVRITNAAEFFSPISPKHATDTIFGKQIRLLGYDIDPPSIMPGEKVRLTYYWQSLVDQEFDYWVVSTLLDASGKAFGKRLSEPVSAMSPTSLWRAGETVLDSFEFQLPAAAHSGKYRVELGMISPTAPDQPLPISVTDDRLSLAPFTVQTGSVSPSAILHPLALRLGTPNAVTLLGYNLVRPTAQPGEPFRIMFYWRSEQSVPTDYSVFLHLVDSNGKIVAQQDGPPQNGDAPTSWWQPNDTVADEHALLIPSGIVPGHYEVEFGVYDPLKGPRLALSDSGGNRIPGDSWRLGVDVLDR